MVHRSLDNLDRRRPFLNSRRSKIAQRFQQYVPAGNKLGGADATHIAAAVRLACTHLTTHDEAFPIGRVVDQVQVLRPAEIWPRDLLDEIADGADASANGSTKNAARPKKTAMKATAASKAPDALQAGEHAGE